MEAAERKTLQEKISAYGLMGTLLGRLQDVVVGGVARPTVYKAYKEGGITARLALILEEAKKTVDQHEARLAQSHEMVAA